MNNKNPLQDLANRIGMYAYLAAVGGLRYWPTVREAVIQEEIYSMTPATRSDEAPAYEYERETTEEKIPA